MAPTKEKTKTTWDIGKLHAWDNNPRKITDEGLERLKWQIQRLGQYKPLLITDDGTVLGGNMRLRAYAELGIRDIWVSIVDAPTEDRKMEYALSDNDRVGQYDEEMLSTMLPNYAIELDKFGVDLKDPMLLKDMTVDPSIIDDISLPEGEKDGFAQMTFTVTAEQGETIRQALLKSKGMGAFTGTGNENTNGNALARICEQFNNG